MVPATLDQAKPSSSLRRSEVTSGASLDGTEVGDLPELAAVGSLPKGGSGIGDKRKILDDISCREMDCEEEDKEGVLAPDWVVVLGPERERVELVPLPLRITEREYPGIGMKTRLMRCEKGHAMELSLPEEGRESALLAVFVPAPGTMALF